MNIIKKYKNASVFWKIFLAVLLVLVLAMVITWIVLWNALKTYENTRPTLVMNRLVEEIQSGDYSKLVEFSNASKLEESRKEDFTEKLKSLSEGKTITYTKAFSADKDRFPAYTLKMGEEKLAKVTLEQTGNQHSFGFEDYQIKAVTEIPIMNVSVTITAPADYSVFVDGQLISGDETYITQKDIAVQGLSGIPEKYFAKPSMIEYTVSDLIELPRVTAEQADGKEALLKKSEDGSVYQVLFGSAENPEEYYSIALEKAKLYSQYVTAWVGQETFLANVLPDSPIRDGLEGIQTGFYTDHKRDYFTDEKTENLQIYSENCFSCDISYTQWVEDIRTDRNFKKGLPSAFTFYFIKENGTWYIADLNLR